MSDINVNQLLSQMRTLATRSGINASPVAAPGTEQINKPDFSGLLKQSIDKVNELQKTSGQMTASFEAGDPSVTLADTMIATQKSSVAFQAATTVRNKLVTAYEEVMRMQV